MKKVTKDLEKLGIVNVAQVYRNLTPAELVEHALKREEGILSASGALVVTTGKYTGRSPKDKYIVDTPGIHEKIAWGNVNKPIEKEKFDSIYNKLIAYLQNREIFIFDGMAGADPACRKKFRIINERASQNLFIHQLLIRPTEEELKDYGHADFTIIAVPGFKCNAKIDGINSSAAIIINYEAKVGIICGTEYSGEIKKSVFSIMNFVMPEMDVLPMHCSANFEGGCYAKCINLDPEHEPDIYNAIKFGSLVENVVMNPVTRELDFYDKSLTENTRVGYPINHIKNAQIPGIGGIPNVVVFLTADAFGVLPPVSRLSRDAAIYHFVTGFTSKLAGTERGITEPQPTFSTCFGEPFMPLDPLVYAEMLGKKIDLHNTKVFLINTGWSGGPYGVGNRMNLIYTRAMVTAALNGELDEVEYKHDDIFNLEIPQYCPNVPSELLNPIDTWANKEAYEAAAKKLAKMFRENFEKKYPNMPEHIVNAGPAYFE